MAGGHPPYSLAALARVREMTAIGSSGSRGMTDENPLRRRSRGRNINTERDADGRTQGEVVVQSRSLIDRASRPF